MNVAKTAGQVAQEAALRYWEQTPHGVTYGDYVAAAVIAHHEAERRIDERFHPSHIHVVKDQEAYVGALQKRITELEDRLRVIRAGVPQVETICTLERELAAARAECAAANKGAQTNALVNQKLAARVNASEAAVRELCGVLALMVEALDIQMRADVINGLSEDDGDKYAMEQARDALDKHAPKLQETTNE